MNRIEDELRSAADQTRRRLADLDTDAALAGVTGRRPRTRSIPVLAGAAAAVVALVAGAALLRDGGDQHVVADGPTTSAAIDADEALRHVFEQLHASSGARSRESLPARSLAEMLPNVVFELPDGTRSTVSDLAVVGRVTSVEPWLGFVGGSADAASGTPTEFDDPAASWRTLKVNVAVARSLVGIPDALESVSVGLIYTDDVSNLAVWDAGLRSMRSAVFLLSSRTPVFADDRSVYDVVEGGAFIVPVGDAARLSLPALAPDRAAELLAATPTLTELIDSGAEPQSVLVVGEDGTVTDPNAPDPTDSGEPPSFVPDGPDLAAPEPGQEITFEGVGDVRLGDAIDPGLVDSIDPDASCGWWGPAEPTHDGNEPLSGLVSGANTATPRISTIYVGRNPAYRTASGVGIGTTMASLQRIYGDRLVVDRADGWEHPTDGLLASYQDVAAVSTGTNALTFTLHDDVVASVKLSAAEFWGDDEGCA